MNNMPPKLRKECADDPFYTKCARFEALRDHECKRNPVTGKLIEWDHSMIHAGKQVQEKFAINPTCWWAHEGPGKCPEIQLWIALNRATDEDLLPFCRVVDYFRSRAFLNKKYGPYHVPKPEHHHTRINYPWLLEA